MDHGGAQAMGRREWAMLLTLAAAWGGIFLYAKLALAELSPLVLVLWRLAIAALVLQVIARLAGYRMPRSLGIWAAFFAMGALNNVIPFTLINYAQTEIASGLASILNGTTPLFTVLLAHFLTRDEKLTAQRLFGVLSGMVGVAIMIGAEALQGLSLHVAGEIAVVAAAVSYAFAGIFGRRFRTLPPLVTAAGQVTASTVVMLLFVPQVEPHWLPFAISRTAASAVLAMALIGTVLGYILYFRILATSGATNLLIVTFLMPFIAILLGGIVLDERLELRHFAGMALIILGVVAIDGRPGRWLIRHASGRNKALAVTEKVQ
jgi:drug/metabolite transporter (DMT)-like permease